MTTLVFDVNETLLDISHMDPIFEDIFGSAAVRKEWFSQVIQDAMVASLIGNYSDFGAIGVSAFELTASRRSIEVDEDDFARVVDALRSLPPHPEVPGQLRRLRGHGFQMVTLTNSPPAMISAQLSNAEISEYFERQLSVDSVREFKPSQRTYEYACEELGEDADQLWLVAAHNWDTSGALAAGWNAAFVARPGMKLSRLDKQPNIVGSTLTEVADELIAALAANSD